MSQTNRSRLILRLSKEKITNGSKIGSKEGNHNLYCILIILL